MKSLNRAGITEKLVLKVETAQKEGDGDVRTMTVLFVTVLVILPFVMDFIVKLVLALGNSFARNFIESNLWFSDAAGYFTVYAFMLFYLLATFEPLASYGYNWNKKYLGFALYIGVGSGVVMYIIDRMTGLNSIGAQEVTAIGILGYLLTWIILPTLTEETLFRGIIQGFYQRNLKKTYTKHNIHIAVFIAVGAELLFHVLVPLYYGIGNGDLGARMLRTIPQLVYVAVFGFISGVVYQRTRSLVGPFLIHALGNGAELLLLWVL